MNEAHRILANEGDVTPTASVQGTHFCFSICFYADRKALLERMYLLKRIHVVCAVAGKKNLATILNFPGHHSILDPVENVPEPEAPIAAEVNLPGANASHRHSDEL